MFYCVLQVGHDLYDACDYHIEVDDFFEGLLWDSVEYLAAEVYSDYDSG